MISPRTIISLEVITPSLAPDDREHLVKELSRDFPWVLDEGWTVEFRGLRRSGPRVALGGRIRSCGPPFPWRGAPLRARIVAAWLVHFVLTLLRPRAGILVAPSPWSGLGGALACSVLTRRPRLVVRVQGATASRSHMRGSELQSRLIERAERFVLTRADLVVPMGTFTRELAEAAGVGRERIVELVFPPIWGERSTVAGDGERVARRRVVCAARFEREKGIDVLLRAWARVVSKWPQAHLQIAGDGPLRAELERLARELGVEAHVSFTGWLPADDMPAFFAGALVEVLPSRWEEGLGMVLVEAGLAGCDLVGSDLGGIRDIVEHGKTGRLVPPDDPEALADVLEDCLARPEAAAQRGAAARQKALEYVSRREREMREFHDRFAALATAP
jgi:glycosyltransferase involved in cell wall biosynthesis